MSKLSKLGFDVSQTSDSVHNLSEFDHVVSYGYKRILDGNTIASAQKPILNLHISYLPYNKGMHPNFWSFFDETPSGVSIHEIDEGIDTGPILLQKEIHFQPKNQTFNETYFLLRSAIEELFLTNLEAITNEEIAGRPQHSGGTYHAKGDLPIDFRGWNCNIYNEIARLRK
jgi:methionyl-tRNA formyltransferase